MSLQLKEKECNLHTRGTFSKFQASLVYLLLFLILFCPTLDDFERCKYAPTSATYSGEVMMYQA